MKKRLLRLLPVAICALSLTGFDALSSQVNAAGISFTPEGEHPHDQDTIRDIDIGNNKPLNFEIFADSFGYTPSNANAEFLEFDLEFFTDNNEYSGQFIPGEMLAVGTQGKIGTFVGQTVIPGVHPHDGVVDFGITLTGVNLFDSDGNLIGTDPASAFDAPSFNEFGESGTEFNQVVEVEKVPEPLTILGSVTALGIGGLLKRENSKKQKKS